MGVRTRQGDDSGALSVWRAPLRDRAEACTSHTLNAGKVTEYTAAPDFRKLLVYIEDTMNVGFVWWTC